MTGFYLLDHLNPHGDHFYRSRRGSVLAIVVHITAGLEDLDAHDDHSAENTAAYAASTDRQVSWHSGSDTDTAFDLLPASFTAFQCQGYNSCTYGHEISKAHPDWRTMDPAWARATLTRAADHLRVKAAELGVPIRKATRAELDGAIAGNGAPVGFIGHHELDPTRRADPGRVGSTDTFPWQQFLALLEGDDMTPQEHEWLGRLHHELANPDSHLNVRLKQVAEVHEALLKGVPDYGVPSMRDSVTFTHYNAAGVDLPGRPSRIKQILAKLGVQV